jgi:phosphatidylglycerophosphatase A
MKIIMLIVAFLAGFQSYLFWNRKKPMPIRKKDEDYGTPVFPA